MEKQDKEKGTQEIKKLRGKLEQYAKEQSFKLNPDDKIVNSVIKGLLMNKKKHGETYCPCRIVTGDKEKDKEIICPCIFHLEEIKERGKCHCNLFVR